MYLGIDMGGSKTLLAVFSSQGKITDSYRLPTNKNYRLFLKELSEALKEKLKIHQIVYCCCAIPGTIDRQAGVGLRFGNLPWKDVPIKHDLELILGRVPVIIENDAKLAGLSEALGLDKHYNKVLYLTVSTGIGDGIIIDGRIDPDLADSEAGQMVVEHDGKLVKWEDVASGRALVAKYGQRADQINDPAIWKAYVPGLALGINELVATLRPDVVVIGGGVGAHLEKFKKYLDERLKSMENEMVKMPPIVKAKRAEEAVVYGCYELIKQQI